MRGGADEIDGEGAFLAGVCSIVDGSDERTSAVRPIFRRMPARRDHPWRHTGRSEAIGEALYEGGIRIIEVPLNSPEPFDSIGNCRRTWATEHSSAPGRCSIRPRSPE